VLLLPIFAAILWSFAISSSFLEDHGLDLLMAYFVGYADDKVMCPAFDAAGKDFIASNQGVSI
jgi:hypothetical protein